MFFMNSGLHQTILAVFIDTQFNNEDMQEFFFCAHNPNILFINLLSLSPRIREKHLTTFFV